MKTKLSILSITAILALLLGACTALPSLQIGQTAPSQPLAQQPAAAAPVTPPVGASGEALAALQGTLESIYNQVNPSVVNIQVTMKTSALEQQMPFQFADPFGGQSPQQQPQRALGSGFVWDSSGYIVTNNHVVDGADTVSVTFSDGRILPAKVVGKDPDADLAVIKVENAGSLQALTLADSDQVKVGQLAIAIGNPFGLEGTMTVGIISALGRSLPVESQAANSATYTIPDIIQTDAPINPGNSGGVLVNDSGAVVGVTAAIESTTNANAGIGFVIPANIVKRVVPELIQNGQFTHVYLGISGGTLTPQIAKEMKLDEGQHGILVVNVTSGGPADKAGLKGSDRQAQVDGADMQVGGDIITAIDGQPVTQFDDLVSYLFSKGEIGKTVSLDLLRNGKSMSVQVELDARPASTPVAENASPRSTSGQVWLGIRGMDMNAEIAKAMNLSEDIQGVLVVDVAQGSPAQESGLQGSEKQVEIQGQPMRVGGDIITAVDGQPISSMQALKAEIDTHNAGDKMQLTVLRGGKQTSLDVTLAGIPLN